MLEEILDWRNVEKALKQVISNKGTCGVDGMHVDELRHTLSLQWQSLRSMILEGRYQPQPVRKVEIPKPQGGTRMLGIPTVLDRLLQQCINQTLNPMYDADFDEWSYGFRPKRNAHQAILQAQSFLGEGYEWTVEIDLAKFFDRVNHDKLMGLLMKRITDKRVLKLIRHYLTAGIMEGGVVSQRTEGTPQGSPLSPLLSNIILHELDKELRGREHKFVRYADDCTIYVKSEKAAIRVAESIIRYIEDTLKLQVNREKTRVGKASESILLGYSFYKDKDGWQIRLSNKTKERIKKKCKETVSRSNGKSQHEQIKQLQAVITGWVNYFILAKAKSVLEELDRLVRVRLRIGSWKNWKKPKTRVWNLRKLGVTKSRAYMWGNSSKGYCRIAHSPILQRALNNDYWRKQGYKGFAETYQERKQIQTSLF
ncbi:MAG: group II intron reverse transcriptase/maturase [Bacteroidota bacterium]|nr:group II intron reverse transcriptase/maturase [Bacteroidota bacterium]